MTVQVTDNRKRVNAIPFRALWYDSSVSIGNQFDITGVVSGDLSIIKTGSAPTSGTIRMCRPLKGDLIEARMTMAATTPFGDFAEIRFYIGKFAADGVTPAVMTENEKAASWFKISGFNTYLHYGSQANIYIDGMNLLPAIPKKGDADFNADGWILGIDIISKGFPDWYLYQFKIDCTVTMAEVRA